MSAHHQHCGRGHTFDKRFHCFSCRRTHYVSERHPSGFCHTCILRHRQYWLSRFTLAEIRMLAGAFERPYAPKQRVAA